MGKGKKVGLCKLCKSDLHLMNLVRSDISLATNCHSKCFYKALRDKGLVNSKVKFNTALDLYVTNNRLKGESNFEPIERFIMKTFRRILYSKAIYRL